MYKHFYKMLNIKIENTPQQQLQICMKKVDHIVDFSS